MTAFWILLGIGLYLVAATVMTALQRRLIYHPSATPAPDPAAQGLAGMSAIRQGDRLLGWFAPPPGKDAPVLVYFHGNRGSVAKAGRKAAPWREWGIGIFAAAYPGFDGNPGRLREAAFYDAARAVLQWLNEQGIEDGRILLYGESLGTGIAVAMAVERSVRAVILESAYTSIPRVASERYPWLPCRWLVRDRYDSLSKVAAIDAPLLLLHGEADRTVPLAHALCLAKAQPRAHLEIIHQATHYDLHDRGATPRLFNFINTVGLSSSSSKIMKT